MFSIVIVYSTFSVTLYFELSAVLVISRSGSITVTVTSSLPSNAPFTSNVTLFTFKSPALFTFSSLTKAVMLITNKPLKSDE